MLLSCASCDILCKKVAPQSPSNKSVPDSATASVLELNQRLAAEADKEINAIAERLNDSLSALGSSLYQRHEQGYWVRVINAGEGDTLAFDEHATIEYAIRLTDGTMAEQTSREITVGRKEVPDAIDITLTRLRHGAHADIIAPWALLYGRMGTEKIPPYSQAIIALTIK
ncbi:MAG TPA: hypothetical protein DEO38_05805 [Bacteroidales bacterium]|nr:hypothetical protein [Bacteroidales bacterium]